MDSLILARAIQDQAAMQSGQSRAFRTGVITTEGKNPNVSLADAGSAQEVFDVSAAAKLGWKVDDQVMCIAVGGDPGMVGIMGISPYLVGTLLEVTD